MAGEILVQAVSELLAEEETRIPIITFNQELDEILSGGISLQKVSEIFGDKGIGKTTLCCQLALDVQIPASLGGLESECVYIDTENTFVKERVKGMAEKFVAHCRSLEASSHLTVDSLLNGIHYIQCGSHSELQVILDHFHKYIRSHRKLKLVIIDSLAFLFYAGSEQFSERGKVLYELFQKLSHLATQYDLAVVVTNNMTTRFSENRFEYRIPFLGETWTHVPNVRIHLEYGGDSRVAKVVKGHVMSKDTAVFRVTSAGIRQ